MNSQEKTSHSVCDVFTSDAVGPGDQCVPWRATAFPLFSTDRCLTRNKVRSPTTLAPELYKKKRRNIEQ